MSLRISRFQFSALILLVGFTAKQPGNAQSVPCAAITRNPLVLESLLDSHSQDADSGAQGPDSPISATQLEQLPDQVIAPLRIDNQPHEFTPEESDALNDAASSLPYNRTTDQTLTFSEYTEQL